MLIGMLMLKLAECQLKADWPNLKCLMLDIHPAALESLISNIASSLTKLIINSCVLDTNALKQLADADLPCLQSLTLGRGIDDRGYCRSCMRALAKYDRACSA